MKKNVSAHSLHGKFMNIMRLYEELDKIPRKFGTDQILNSSEVHLIELIGENEGRSVTDLAKLQGVTKGAVSQTLKRLEKKGVTLKEEDPANSSRSLVTLTNKGKTAFYAHKHWHETMDGGFKEYFINLGQDKIEFLAEVLTMFENFLRKRISTEK
jgi:DNA-binding MarR family transcriptional regulator